jgi:hypothetical protein
MAEGQTVGRYTLLEQVGKGGMAEVFKAEERLPDGGRRVVAVKRLFPQLAADREFVGMFVNEARIASSMAHPNIVRTHDMINTGSHYYIIMEFLAGMDLEDLIVHSPPGRLAMSLHEIAYAVHEVALGLGYAHRGGADPASGPVVHRDISPGNVLVDCTGRVLITDFGIARAAQYAQSTMPGVLKGKYEYMSPEYVAGKPFDGRSDLFSLGVVLYELLTGTNPFLEVLPKDTWERVLGHEPPPPSQLCRQVPQALDAIVAQALCKDPAGRIPSGEVFARALQPFVGKPEATARVLGRRVSRAMDRPAAAANAEPLAAFLPGGEDDDEEGTDAAEHTAEMHMDDLLGLVEQQQVPRPDFASLADESSATHEPTVPEKAAGGGRRRRWPWLALGLLLLAGAGVAVSLLWPRPTGFLTVTADRRSEVYVDGERMGVAPLKRLPLDPGRYAVEVRRPGSQRVKSYRRAIVADRETRLRVRWTRRRRRRRRVLRRKKRRKRPQVNRRRKRRRR